jgi:hypothetical protein
MHAEKEEIIMNLNKNAFIICFVSILSCFISSKTVLAFVTQGDDYLNKDFTNETRIGSMHYLKGISYAIWAFSAIDNNDVINAKKNLDNAKTSWNDSKLHYQNAKIIGAKYGVFTSVNQWINVRVNAIISKYHLSRGYGIGKDINDKINCMGAKGLIEMTMDSSDRLQERIDGILKKYDFEKKPSYKELLTALNFISYELRKGIIASELFLKP